jgi:hypothetical protein
MVADINANDAGIQVAFILTSPKLIAAFFIVGSSCKKTEGKLPITGNFSR